MIGETHDDGNDGEVATCRGRQETPTGPFIRLIAPVQLLSFQCILIHNHLLLLFNWCINICLWNNTDVSKFYSKHCNAALKSNNEKVNGKDNSSAYISEMEEVSNFVDSCQKTASTEVWVNC